MAEQLQRENQYPYEMMPLLFAIIKSTRGNFQEAHKLIQEGNLLTTTREPLSNEQKGCDPSDEKGNETVLDLSTRKNSAKKPKLGNHFQVENKSKLEIPNLGLNHKTSTFFRPHEYERSTDSIKRSLKIENEILRDHFTSFKGISEDEPVCEQNILTYCRNMERDSSEVLNKINEDSTLHVVQS